MDLNETDNAAQFTQIGLESFIDAFGENKEVVKELSLQELVSSVSNLQEIKYDADDEDGVELEQ